MSSKNNPLNRNRDTRVKTFDGKKVKPVLFIDQNRRFMAAQFEDGKLVLDPQTKTPLPYQSI